MKYIIDVPDFDKYNMPSATKGRIVGIPMSVNGKEYYVPTDMVYVAPYTESDRKQIEDAQEEAWEFAKQVSIMKPEDKKECWGTAKFNTINFGYSYQEAKDRYEAWKAKQESRLEVGNEVENQKFGTIGVITNIDNSLVHILWESGRSSSYDFENINLKKTGRHFPQVAELLKAMKGEEA